MSAIATLISAIVMFLGSIGTPAAATVDGSPPDAPSATVASASQVAYPWHITDSESSPGAYCTYDGGDPRRRVFVPVHMPFIYWPNAHGGRTDRGTVGWQIQLQVAPTVSGPWRAAYTSSITTGVATDSRPAEVAKHAINWRVIRGDAYYRIEDRAIWYRSDGSRLATRTQFVHWYQLARAESPWHEGSPGGWNIGATLGVRHQDCPSLLTR